jgi:uncharacterized protein YdhG (YjbR/CyaY superfamily)
MMKHIRLFENFILNEGKLRSELLGGKGQKAEYDSLTQSERDELENLFYEIGQKSPEAQSRIKRSLSGFNSLVDIKDSMVQILSEINRDLEKIKNSPSISYFKDGEEQDLSDLCINIGAIRLSLSNPSISRTYLKKSPIFYILLNGKDYFVQPFKDYTSDINQDHRKWNVSDIQNSPYPAILSDFIDGVDYQLGGIESLKGILEIMKYADLEYSDMKNISPEDIKKGEIQSLIYDLMLKKYRENDLKTSSNLLKILSHDNLERLKLDHPDIEKTLKKAQTSYSIISRFKKI